MGLFQRAYETYEYHKALAGVEREGHPTLSPVSHIVQKAQLEISIDQDGRFMNARAVGKGEERTIIPASEESAGRTIKGYPHPLCDQLCYVSSCNPERYAMYIFQLEAWASSPYSHPKVKAVLAYVKGGTILSDLAEAQLITVDASGVPKEEKSLVRWIVNGLGDEGRCWLDPTLFQAYIDYYAAQTADKDAALCLISGQMRRTTQNHPKGIVAANYGAKLISANDESGFTYRGRFTQAEQACTVSYEASQKAHSALQWVAADQGEIIGGRTFVCWNPKGKKTPKPTRPFGRREAPSTTPTDYRCDLKETILGYRNELSPIGKASEDVIIASFDAATTGRLSVTYYRELAGSDFLERLENWYASCMWSYGLFGYQSPAIWRIAQCAYGVERGGKLEADDKVMKGQVQRLLPCVVDGAPIPSDMAGQLAQCASRPLAYSDSNRRLVLSTACAVIRKVRNDMEKKERYTMYLDENNHERSYLFGRLLAVLEKAERDTYDKDEKREPNAIRMQAAYCDRPMNQFRVLYESLTPYLQRLSPGSRAFYRGLIGGIVTALEGTDADELNRKLDDTYLLGYFLQREALYPKKNRDGKNTENEETEEHEA